MDCVTESVLIRSIELSGSSGASMLARKVPLLRILHGLLEPLRITLFTSSLSPKRLRFVVPAREKRIVGEC